MKNIGILAIFAFILIAGYVLINGRNADKKTFDINNFAPRPPMGWNSFDAWDCRIDEETFKKTVDVIDEKLKPYGWEYAVIDYIWWHPDPGHWNTAENHFRRIGHPNIRYNEDGTLLNPGNTRMDEYGRLIPAIERFPSSKNNSGFKSIGDYVHSKGLKFGIHIMRGIHTAAVINKLPIKGTKFTADQIAEPWDTCRWNNHMYGVDPTKPGAQEYYNSLFEMYAEWGVDYVKADDVLYPPFHEGEVTLMKNAIEHCGRPIILSLSPGEAHLGKAEFLKENANLWRISADFWDEWEHLKKNFELLNSWSPHTGNGSWPDADMIPFGRISLQDRPHGPERMSLFSENEHYTLMSLWSIARSPLMIGSDLLSTPDSILSFFTNEEILYVNQYSENGRQAVNEDGKIIWIANDQNSDDVFVGLFNTTDETQEVSFDLEWEMLRGTYSVRDLWEKKDIEKTKGHFKQELGPHLGKLYRLRSLEANKL